MPINGRKKRTTRGHVAAGKNGNGNGAVHRNGHANGHQNGKTNGEGQDRPVISVRLSPELEDAFNLALSEVQHRLKKLPPETSETIVESALRNYLREAGYM